MRTTMKHKHILAQSNSNLSSNQVVIGEVRGICIGEHRQSDGHAGRVLLQNIEANVFRQIGFQNRKLCDNRS